MKNLIIDCRILELSAMDHFMVNGGHKGEAYNIGKEVGEVLSALIVLIPLFKGAKFLKNLL